MKATKYFVALTAIVLATELNQLLTHTQIPEEGLTKMFNAVVVQRCPLRKSQLMEFVVAQPPVDGRPDGRRPAGTRAT